MIIRRSRWLLIVSLFVLGPVVGVIAGLMGGQFLIQAFDSDDSDEVSPAFVEVENEQPQAVTSSEVVLPGGEKVALDELAPGRMVAIVVMKDANCPVCQRQLKVLSNRLSEIERRGGTVVGLSDANRCVNEGLMNRLGLNFPVVADPDHEVLEAFGMTLPDRRHVMPGVIFIDEQGEVDFVHKGRAPGQAQERMIIQRMK